MRLACFNVENLFRRPRALNTAGWQAGHAVAVLTAYQKLEEVFHKTRYDSADRESILKHLKTLGLVSSDESQWAFLRRSRGQLLRRPKRGPVEVIANGRADWIGWLELKREAVNEIATRNTARVVANLRADVLAVVEAEDRPALERFVSDVMPSAFPAASKPWAYRHVMLIDGNDDRGIDVGLMTRNRYPIGRVRSHVDDRDSACNAIFSRDCAEYEIPIAGGDALLILVNHFKSKGYGKQADSDATRRQQAARVAKIYAERRAEGWQRVAVVGDLNDTPDSKPLAPLIAKTDLRDVIEHPAYIREARSGTYGTSNDKIDYLLLSPALFASVSKAGVDRSGVWRGPRVKDPWTMLDTVTSALEQASDHAAVWADLRI